MTSLVNPSNINGNYPIAGQDNDSQGFRDNFTNIRNNFTFIKSEIEDLQAKSVLKSALIGTTLNNDFQGSKVKNLQVSNLTETVKDLGQYSSATLQIDLAEGNVVKLVATAGNPIEINSVIKNWPSSLQYTRILVYITIPSTDITLTVPQSWTTDLSSIPGLRRVSGTSVISYTDPGDYIYEVTSVDSGTTVYFRELTTGNAIFRDPNFYMLGYGIGKVDDSPQRTGFQNPTLILGFGKYLGGTNINSGVAYLVDDLKDGNDSLLIKGSITSYQSQIDDSANVSAGLNSLTSAGFSVVKDRTYIDAEVVSLNKIENQDLIGYFNAIGYTPNNAGATGLAYQQLAAIQFVANGVTASPYGIGGNIVFKTKGDGTLDSQMPNATIGHYNYRQTQGNLRTAMTIDQLQNVTIFGNLDVKGKTTYIESTALTISDINITLGTGGTEATNQGAGFAVASDAADGGANLTLISAGWITNRRFTIANTSPANALVVSGNARVGGNLYVDGNLIVSTVSYEYREIVSTTETVQGNMIAASSTASTSTTTGALVVTGGAGIGNGLYVNGTTYLQNVSSANALITGGSAYNLVHLAATGGAVTTFNAANFTSANLWISGGVIGMTTAGVVTPASNVYAITGYFDNISSPNAVISGGSISGVNTTSANSVATNFSTGNARISGGYIQGLSNVYATTAQFTNISSGNVVLSGGYAPFLTNVFAVNAQFNALNATFANATTLGAGTATAAALNSSFGNITTIGGTTATIGAINSNFGNITTIGGTTATIGAINSNFGNITTIGGTTATIGAVNSNFGNITTLGAGTATAAQFNSSSANVSGPLWASTFSSGNIYQTGGQSIQTANILIGSSAGINLGPSTILHGSGTSGTLGAPTGGNIWLQSANITLATGTTAIPPLRFSPISGAAGVTTTPLSGSMEYDGSVFYATPTSLLLGTGRNIVSTSSYLVLNANVDMNNSTLVSTLGATYGALGGPIATGAWLGNAIVAAGTIYDFEGKYHYRYGGVGTGVSTTATQLGFTFAVGTGAATVTSYNYQVTTKPGPVRATTQVEGAALLATSFSNTVSFSGTTVLPTVSATSLVMAPHAWHSITVEVKGFIRVGTSGNLTPTVHWITTAPGVVTTALSGSYTKLTPLGLGTATGNIVSGGWSTTAAF